MLGIILTTSELVWISWSCGVCITSKQTRDCTKQRMLTASPRILPHDQILTKRCRCIYLQNGTLTIDYWIFNLMPWTYKWNTQQERSSSVRLLCGVMLWWQNSPFVRLVNYFNNFITFKLLMTRTVLGLWPMSFEAVLSLCGAVPYIYYIWLIPKRWSHFSEIIDIISNGSAIVKSWRFMKSIRRTIINKWGLITCSCQLLYTASLMQITCMLHWLY